MKALLIGLTTAATLGLAAPASAQVYFGAGPGGFGIGIGAPGYYYSGRPYYRDYNGAYVSECRTVRERIVQPSGWVDYRDRQICD
jgi:hypothetical protein